MTPRDVSAFWLIMAFEHAEDINPVLGRVSTPEELAFLESGGFSG